MRIVTESECHGWASQALGTPFSWSAMERAYGDSGAYLLPTDAGRKTALARLLTSSIESGEGLLWITAWGVFPSSENMPLFDGYRLSLGEERPLRAAPGHIFGKRDLREVECLLDLALYFFWDACIVDTDFSWLRLSHDEVLTINAKDRAVMQSWQESLAAFGLKELTSTTP